MKELLKYTSSVVSIFGLLYIANDFHILVITNSHLNKPKQYSMKIHLNFFKDDNHQPIVQPTLLQQEDPNNLDIHGQQVPNMTDLHLKPEPQHKDPNPLDILGQQLPNLPDFYLKSKKSRIPNNSSCGTYPELFDIKFSNVYWQLQETSKVTFLFWVRI